MTTALKQKISPIILGENDNAISETMFVTPAMAEEWLKHNENNRHLNMETVREYVEAMQEKNWPFDGSPIQISDDGILLNGQHRLTAIVFTGITVKMVVVTGISKDTQLSMDIGRPRKLPDFFFMQHEFQPMLCSSVTLIYKRWLRGQRGRNLTDVKNSGQPKENLKFYHDRPEIKEAIVRTAALRRTALLPGRVLGLLQILFYDADPVDAEKFFFGLSSGSELSLDSPILALRHILYEAQTGLQRPHPTFLCAVTILAWNQYHAGQNVTPSKLKYGEKDEYPVPLGWVHPELKK